MSIDLDHFCLICLLANPYAVELSTCTGVGGWGCPISMSVLRSATPSLVLLKSAPHSASAVDAITCLMMVEVDRMAPLLGDSLFVGVLPR